MELLIALVVSLLFSFIFRNAIRARPTIFYVFAIVVVSVLFLRYS